MFIVFIILVLVVGIIYSIGENKRRLEKEQKEREYRVFKTEILNELGLNTLDLFPYFDTNITVKSRQALENYDDIKFFRENNKMLEKVEKIIEKKNNTANIFKNFFKDNKYIDNPHYSQLKEEINKTLNRTEAYIIKVNYITSSGNNLGLREIAITQNHINRYKKNPALLMTKGEYNKLIKEKEKKELSQKQQEYYDIVNNIIDYANANKDSLITKENREDVDNLIGELFDRTVNSIKKIKTLDSEEWPFIKDFMLNLKNEIEKIINKNQQIIEYYESPNFLKIKETCEVLMSSQKEFNEYINEKVQFISQLFGTRIVRDETIADDEYNYIRPYKKTITPFTAEVSSTVFASAENNPLEYIIKYFYTNKKLYPEQIKKLYQLIEELETLSEARQIIENYKIEYQQYLGDVPDFIMKNDEAGFYSRLGFATINESVLIVEYKFSYTSNGGMVQRSFTIPMKEETIIELIKALESKLTISAFIKEQRTLMTKKIREFIKTRDNFTCCNCNNSIEIEPNLLLEIDHIIPVSKGGETIEENLQTLCWKCNRAKSNKILTVSTN
ncbi:HNH endonuclease [Cetobacterium sp.]|uniref:HNH endonuclease n=1 Tax=Cetobacterium sp. TaxID=2071632 RepID=UPI003EE5FD57